MHVNLALHTRVFGHTFEGVHIGRALEVGFRQLNASGHLGAGTLAVAREVSHARSANEFTFRVDVIDANPLFAWYYLLVVAPLSSPFVDPLLPLSTAKSRGSTPVLPNPRAIAFEVWHR